MKRLTTILAACIAVNGAFANVTENFNSRSEAGLTKLKFYLQDHCWQFIGMEVNFGNWKPAIEGDGAMVSTAAASRTQNTGILSPLVSLNASTVHVSFKYAFSADVTDRRWIKIYAANGDNSLAFLLDSVELSGNNSSVYSYDKSLNVASTGNYKIYINYQGVDGQNRIAIDQLSVDANPAYSGGCNLAPVAKNDQFNGNADRTASGNVLTNDSDPEKGVMTAQLVTNSPDGIVTLKQDGSFSFAPNAAFNGNSTSFKYITCDNGSPALCSEPVTATIHFSKATAAVTIADFNAEYSNDQVNLKWAMSGILRGGRFDIERSTDGQNFKTVGSTVVDFSGKDFVYNDEVSKTLIRKNDLYYRLKQTDAEGKSTYSKVMVVRVYHSKTLQSLSVTPSPSVNDIKVNVQLNQGAYIVVKVANEKGEEVMRKITKGNFGTNQVRLEGTSNLGAGVYYLEMIVNSNERMNMKLIKG